MPNLTVHDCNCRECMTDAQFMALFGVHRDHPESQSIVNSVRENDRNGAVTTVIDTESRGFWSAGIADQLQGQTLTAAMLDDAMDTIRNQMAVPIPMPEPQLFNFGALEAARASRSLKIGSGLRKLSPKFRLKDGVVSWRGVKAFVVNKEARALHPELPINRMSKTSGLTLRDFQVIAKDCFNTYMQDLSRSRSSAIHVAVSNNRPGSRMRRFLQPRIDAIDRDKKPRDQKRHLGIEIEFIADHDQSDVIEAFAKARLDEYVTYHSDSSVGSDGDCGGDNCDGSGECDHDLEEDQECEAFHCSCDNGHGHEICVLVPTPLLESVIERVCKVLNDELSARVDKTCGLHVHLDCRKMAKEPMYDRLTENVDFLMAMLPGSRRKSQYCRVNPKDRTLQEMIDGSDRYWAINPRSISEHGTIELRAHSGTTDPIKIVQWIKLISFIAYTRKDKPPIASFSQLVAEGLNLHTVLYFVERYKKFSSHKRGNWTPTDLNEMNVGQLNERDAEVA